MSDDDACRAREGLLFQYWAAKNHIFVFYVFIVYILMLLSKGTETCMNFRYESFNILISLGCLPSFTSHE